jgi:hypothetical protein
MKRWKELLAVIGLGLMLYSGASIYLRPQKFNGKWTFTAQDATGQTFTGRLYFTDKAYSVIADDAPSGTKSESAPCQFTKTANGHPGAICGDIQQNDMVFIGVIDSHNHMRFLVESVNEVVVLGTAVR